jgi:transposase
MLHRTRDLLIRQRSSLISAIRAHFAEFGDAPFPIKRARSLATGFGARSLSRKGISFALTRPLAILVQLRPLAFRHEC